MLFRSGFLVISLCAADLLYAQQQAEGPASFWRREFAAHRSLSRRFAEEPAPKPKMVEISKSDEAAVLPEQVASNDAQKKPAIRERLTALRSQILHTEERLLFTTAPEERALQYNASRRSEMSTLKQELARRGEEDMQFLRELSGEYRTHRTTPLREEWMRSNRDLVVKEISSFLEKRRRGSAIDTAMAEIASTDERLRQLIQKKQGDQRRYGRERNEVPLEEVMRVELPVEATAPAEVALTPDELRLFQELFPVR